VTFVIFDTLNVINSLYIYIFTWMNMSWVTRQDGWAVSASVSGSAVTGSNPCGPFGRRIITLSKLFSRIYPGQLSLLSFQGQYIRTSFGWVLNSFKHLQGAWMHHGTYAAYRRIWLVHLMQMSPLFDCPSLSLIVKGALVGWEYLRRVTIEKGIFRQLLDLLEWLTT